MLQGVSRKRRKTRRTQEKRTLSLLDRFAWDVADPEAEIRRLLDGGKPAEALRLAQRAQQHRKSPESEGLLAAAYLARIESLDRGMGREADALLELALGQCPQWRAQLEALRPRLLARQARFEELLRPLDNPELGDLQRAAIDEAIRREAVDLPALAATGVLPRDHALRVGAAAVGRALTAVTSGPVDEGQLALTEVSRRSPLAPWRLLVLAIARFYDGDDEDCARYLDRIDPASAPARLVAALRAMIGRGAWATPPVMLSPRAEALIAQVHASDDNLRDRLQEVDKQLDQQSPRPRPALRAVREAVRQCQRCRPELLEQLRQQLSVRCWLAEFPAAQVAKALGGPTRRDARFWRLLARANERRERVLFTCALWDEYRRRAVLEGQFADDGPEAAAVHLHVAQLLVALPAPVLAREQTSFASSFEGFGSWYADQEPQQAAARADQPPDVGFTDPQRQFERACACDPRAESFEPWLQWARRQPDWKAGDRAAGAWHRALPADGRPLLYLIVSSEERQALTKARSYLDRAEQIDGHKPEVQQARIRLTIALAVRHLKQRQLRLAEQDLATLAALPQLSPADDDPAALAALRALCCALQGDMEQAARAKAETARLLQSEVAAQVFGEGLQRACGVSRKKPFVLAKPRKTGSGPPGASAPPLGALASAVARASRLATRCGTAVEIPQSWESQLSADVLAPDGSPTLEAAPLCVLGQAALQSARPRLAYRVAAAGLALTGSDPLAGRFLLLRAQSLPEWEPQRRASCLAAAAALGRAHHDPELISEAVDLSREDELAGSSWPFGGAAEPQRMTVAQAQALLEEERLAQKYPRSQPRSRMTAGFDPSSCLCPACRAERGEISAAEMTAAMAALALEEDDEDDDDFDEDDEDLDDFFVTAPGESDVPPELMAAAMPVFLEAVQKFGPDALDLDPEVIRRLDADLYARMRSVMGALEEASSGSRPSSGKRRSKAKGGRAKRRKRRRR